MPVAAEVARRLDAELDVLVARKLGAPGQPELAIGAVTANGGEFINEEMVGYLGVSRAYLREVRQEQMAEARRRETRFRGNRPAEQIQDRVVILVDDGLATGATMRAAARSVRKHGPAFLVVAVPVGSREACAALREDADEVVCPADPRVLRGSRLLLRELRADRGCRGREHPPGVHAARRGRGKALAMARARERKAPGRTGPLIFSGSGGLSLAAAVAGQLDLQLGKRDLERFPDGECHVRILESVRGQDVYFVVSTGPPVEANLVELLLLADACRRAGAARRTAVIPYFGYARQDRRVSGRESVGARLVADLLEAGGLDRVVAIDLHSPALEGFFSLPLEHLTAVPLLAEALRHSGVGASGVVVAPDLGAARLADRYAKLLDLPVAIVHKTRISGREVAIHGVSGDVEGRQPLIVDDMISTGGTIEAAARGLAAAGSLPVAAVAATHGLFVAGAEERLAAVNARRVIVTDTVAAPPGLRLPLEVVSVAPILARAVRHLHEDRSLADLVAGS